MNKISYRCAVASLMYVMVCTRFDIAYTIGVVSFFMTNLDEVVKWIIMYLKSISRSHLCFRSGDPVLQVYTNADYVDEVDSVKFTSGYMMT